jgi:hypothetical protein
VAETWPCNVCGEEVDEATSSVCTSCNERYHLNQRQDRPGKDCGSVWINDELLALEFACQRCLDAAEPGELAPRIQKPEKPKPRVLRPRLGRRRYRKRA